MIKKLCTSGWALALTSICFAQVNLTVDAKDGEVVSGERVFHVSVNAKDLVNQVEFSVGNNLKGSDTSKPYEFTLDTINESEGEIALTFEAYTSEGDSAKKTIKVKIDNQLGKGAEHFVNKANEAMGNSQWDEAVVQSRIALKATPGYVPAHVALARAYFQKRVYDKAQKSAEDAVKSDPDNIDALDLLSAISLKKAFSAKGSTESERLSRMLEDMKQAAESRSKVYEIKLSKYGAPTSENLIQFADLAIRGGRFRLAIDALTTANRADERRTDVANRLIYAQLRAGLLRDALTTVDAQLKRGRPDAVTYGLAAILYHSANMPDKAQNAERQALLSDPQSLGMKSAMAHLALRNRKASELGRLVSEMQNSTISNNAVDYYACASSDQMGEFERARRHFESALLAEPLSYDMYILAANQAIAFYLQKGLSDEAKQQRDLAHAYLDAALSAKPESFEAFTGLSILCVTENNLQDAIKNGLLAVKTGPEYAAGHYVLSLALSLEADRLRNLQQTAEANRSEAEKNGLTAEKAKFAEQAARYRDEAFKAKKQSDSELKEAGRCDPTLVGASVPLPTAAWLYLSRYGRMPVLASFE